MQILYFAQYSPEWYLARVGLPTSSSADKIITPKTAKLSTQCVTYMHRLLAEKRGIIEDSMEPTDWMLRGHELEPAARELYEAEYCLDVTQVGFVINSDGTAGCSPDGLIFNGDTPIAGFEVKCPKASTHIGYLLNGGLPAYYKPQVHMSMVISGIPTWRFMSYHPDLKPLFVDVEWDDYTDKVKAALTEFIQGMSTADQELAA